MTAHGVSDEEKAARIVHCVTDQVKNCAQKFHDFIEVLKGEPVYGEIVDKILSAYGMLLLYYDACTDNKLE